MDIYKKLINEIINMKDISIPDIRKYVEKDIASFYIKHESSICKNTSDYLHKYFKNILFWIIIRWHKFDDDRYESFESFGSFVRSGLFRYPLIKIEIVSPKDNIDIDKIIWEIDKTLVHELVHYKQIEKTNMDIEKSHQDYNSNFDPYHQYKEYVFYFIHQMEIGARAYEWAKKYKGRPFKEVVKIEADRFNDAVQYVWHSLTNQEKKKVLKGWENLKKQYYNQVYREQQN
jgi:hypothetical protein